MKKIYIIVAAALAFVGCAKQEMAPVNNIGDNAIDFSSYIGREVTKADNSLTTSGFRVSAYPTGNATAYFENVDFTWDSSKSRYTSSTTKYWPTTGTLDFYAVSPKVNMSTKKVAYTGIDGATDFCAAKAATQSYSSSGTALTFGHKLTKVVFKFTGDKLTGTGANTNLSYEITEVKISALGTSTYDVSADTWTTPTTSKTYTVTTNGSTAFTATLNSSKTTSDNSAALYLLPGQPSSGSVTLSIKYQVKENGKVIDNKWASSAATKDLSSNANTNWQKAKSIVYNVTVAPSSSATPITFSANTADWGADTQIYVPQVSSITVSPASVSDLAVGGTTTLTATVLPADAAKKDVTWSSSNTAVATVNASTGVVTGVAEGTATITATAQDGSGVTGTCEVTVVPQTDDFSPLRNLLAAAALSTSEKTVTIDTVISGECNAPVVVPSGVTLKFLRRDTNISGGLKATSGTSSSFLKVESGGILLFDPQGQYGARFPIYITYDGSANIDTCVVCYGIINVQNPYVSIFNDWYHSLIDISSGRTDRTALLFNGDMGLVTAKGLAYYGIAIGGKIQRTTGCTNDLDLKVFYRSAITDSQASFVKQYGKHNADATINNLSLCFYREEGAE